MQKKGSLAAKTAKNTKKTFKVFYFVYMTIKKDWGNQIAPCHFVPRCPAGFTFGEADLVTYDTQKDPLAGVLLRIGVTRFELMTFCSQSRRSTRLSYTPSAPNIATNPQIYKNYIHEKNYLWRANIKGIP